jgi:hypothetical protein
MNQKSSGALGDVETTMPTDPCGQDAELSCLTPRRNLAMINSLQKSSLVLLLLLGCSACSYTSNPQPPAPAPQAVVVSPTPEGTAPATVTVPQGTTIVKTY